MRTARPRGLTPDGSELIVVTESGEELAIAVDDRLRAALRRDRPGLAQMEMLMESELRPREIQDRIRAGASAEQVAEEAGVEVGRIQAFAAPVLAERAHVASLALASSVRRRGEPLVGHSLREVVTDQLVKHGLSTQDLVWDAWRGEDRQWRLVATLTEEGEDVPVRRGLFRFDLRARFSTADNDDARWLLAELTTARRTSTPDPDSEPTEDLEDSLALVRALSEGRPLSEPGFLTEPEESREDSGPIWRPGAPRNDSGRLPRLAPAGPPRPAASAPTPAPPAVPVEEDPYDIIPDDQSDLDVLYEMLGGLHEDSVTIYPGLSDPVPVVEPGAAPEEAPSRAEKRRRRRRRHDHDDSDEASSGSGATTAEPAAEEAGGGTGTARSGATTTSTGPASGEPQEETATTTGDEQVPGAAAQDESEEIEQPSLLEDDPDATSRAPEQPAPARKPGRRKRASVPSWDEIVFGSPKR